MIGASLELIRTIALLCSVSALENQEGSWTELPDTDKYQHQCQVYYLKCVDSRKTSIDVEDQLVYCIKTRSIKRRN